MHWFLDSSLIQKLWDIKVRLLIAFWVELVNSPDSVCALSASYCWFFNCSLCFLWVEVLLHFQTCLHIRGIDIVEQFWLNALFFGILCLHKEVWVAKYFALCLNRWSCGHLWLYVSLSFHLQCFFLLLLMFIPLMPTESTCIILLTWHHRTPCKQESSFSSWWTWTHVHPRGRIKWSLSEAKWIVVAFTQVLLPFQSKRCSWLWHSLFLSDKFAAS